jgi:hypothetical protein
MTNQIAVQTTGANTVSRVWVVTAPSAVHMGVCFLGRGATKNEAIADAYGPNWQRHSRTRQNVRHADIYETTVAEADALEHGV